MPENSAKVLDLEDRNFGRQESFSILQSYIFVFSNYVIQSKTKDGLQNQNLAVRFSSSCVLKKTALQSSGPFKQHFSWGFHYLSSSLFFALNQTTTHIYTPTYTFSRPNFQLLVLVYLEFNWYVSPCYFLTVLLHFPPWTYSLIVCLFALCPNKFLFCLLVRGKMISRYKNMLLLDILTHPAVSLIESVVTPEKTFVCGWNLPFSEEYTNDLRPNASAIPSF